MNKEHILQTMGKMIMIVESSQVKHAFGEVLQVVASARQVVQEIADELKSIAAEKELAKSKLEKDEKDADKKGKE